MLIEDKLTILADTAKYDVSCASSGSRRKNSGRRLGNTAPCGICHTYTEDGRCVALLKILYTNACIYDCSYCANRVGSDIPRAAFTPAEIVSLTIDFYCRNYIEGLFLSSGIMCSPNDTMERLVRTVRDLRSQDFNGYIHLKCVPYASRRLIRQAGRIADRLSVNIELPSEMSLRRLTRDKTYASVITTMETIRDTIIETGRDRRQLRHAPAFAPAGQSTQLIIGASPETDYDILRFVLESIPGRNGGRQKARIDSRIRIDKLALQVRREAHRMKGFIRFQHSGRDRYLAFVAPRCDVLPLIRRHFETRFADQRWIIYDTSRNYGLCYDRHHTRRVTVNAGDLTGVDPGQPPADQFCRNLWQRYFAAVNIAARDNPQLHASRLPRRF